MKNNYKISPHESDLDSNDKTVNYLDEVQAGEGWSCMWLNHFKREQDQINKRNDKYEKNNQKIMNNPSKYGRNYNDLSERRKNNMQKSQLNGVHGSGFVANMSGCPIQKVHKLKQKKREKLTKYLQMHPLEANYGSKSRLQGNGVGLNTTPDYNYYKVLNPEKQAFKNSILNQVNSNKERKIKRDKIIQDSDMKNSKIYEKKMKIIERLQQATRNKQRNALRHDMDEFIYEKQLRSFYR